MDALRDFVDFLIDCWPPLALALVLIGVLVGFIIAVAKVDTANRLEFMAECEQHRPKYECTALWRAGEPGVVPVPVVIPVR